MYAYLGNCQNLVQYDGVYGAKAKVDKKVLIT